MKIVNMTEMTVSIVNDRLESVATFPPSGTALFAAHQDVSHLSVEGALDTIPVVRVGASISNSPERKVGVAYIVTQDYFDAVAAEGEIRYDLLVPSGQVMLPAGMVAFTSLRRM